MASVFVKKVNGYQELFNHLHNEHGLILLESEIHDIERILFKEIELPSEGDVFSKSISKYSKYEPSERSPRTSAFQKGANFILNKLKGENK